MAETLPVCLIKEQGGKENPHEQAADEWSSFGLGGPRSEARRSVARPSAVERLPRLAPERHVNPEVRPRAKRRSFPASYKMKILAETDHPARSRTQATPGPFSERSPTTPPRERTAERLRKAEIIIDVKKLSGTSDPYTCWTRNSDPGTLVRREQWPPTFWCSVNP